MNHSNSDGSFESYDNSSDDEEEPERSCEKQDADEERQQNQQRSSGGAESGGENDGSSGALPDTSTNLSSNRQSMTAHRNPEHVPLELASATDTAPAELDKSVPNTPAPGRRRRRALSYESGLAELTKRVVRQMQDVADSDKDSLRNNGNAVEKTSMDPPEDRSRAAAAMARIQKRRAGSAGGGGGGAWRRQEQQQQQHQIHQQEEGNALTAPGVVTIAKSGVGHNRRRSSSEPPLLSRTGPRYKNCGNDAVKGKNTSAEQDHRKDDAMQQQSEREENAESVSAPTENPTSADLQQIADTISPASSCVSFDLNGVPGLEDEVSELNTTPKNENSAKVERPSNISRSLNVPAATLPEGTGMDNLSTASRRGSTASHSELESRALAQNFVMEHRIFLRAILELLAERDQNAVEADANDPHTIKAGPLKKASHLVRGVWKWKVKYVEIRRGLFSYYEDSEGGLSSSFNMGGGNGSRRGSVTPAADAEEDDVASPAGSGGEENDTDQIGASSSAPTELRRKSIPLRAATCTCRAVKVSNKALPHTPLSPNGAIFELTVEGGPRRLWMCTTREERQAWIHAIHEAMIGGSVTRGDNFSEYSAGGAVPSRSPYRNDLESYLRLQGELRNATCKDSYVGALADVSGGIESLNVPVQWIKERIEVSSTGAVPTGAFLEDGVSSGVAQLWKDMLRDSVSINEEVYTGDGGHGPERIVGALTKCIMDHDRSATQNVNATRAYRKKFGIAESQAVSYARDVLLACNRTRSGGDSYYCMDTLCSNSDLVVLCPSSSEAEPLRITVRHAMNDERSRRSSAFHGGNDMSGWIQTRSGSQKSWKKRFGVLSEGVLSYYEQAHPRPHGLRGQLLLAGATMGVSQVGILADDGALPSGQSGQEGFKRIRNGTTRYIVCIISKDRSKERQIRFDDQMEFFTWNQAFRDAIQSGVLSVRVDRREGTTARPPNPREGQGIVSLQGASALIANRFRGLSVRARDGSGSPLRPEMRRLARDMESGEGTAHESVYAIVDANVEQDEASGRPPMQSNPSHLDRSQKLRSTHWKNIKGGRARSTVEIAVQNAAVYKICTTDPQGDEKEDTWAMVQTKFLQNFRVSGGPNGRMMRGEEIVQINFLEGLVSEDAFDLAFTKSKEDEAVGTILRCASTTDVEGLQQR